MANIATTSSAFGATAQARLNAGSRDAQTAAASKDLKGAFEAQGIMTEATLEAGSIASTNSSYNQAYQQAGNK